MLCEIPKQLEATAAPPNEAEQQLLGAAQPDDLPLGDLGPAQRGRQVRGPDIRHVVPLVDHLEAAGPWRRAAVPRALRGLEAAVGRGISADSGRIRSETIAAAGRGHAPRQGAASVSSSAPAPAASSSTAEEGDVSAAKRKQAPAGSSAAAPLLPGEKPRPPGRAPKGKAWDRKLGQWVPMEGYNLDGTLIDGGAQRPPPWARRPGGVAPGQKPAKAWRGRRRRQGTSASEGRAAAQRWGRRRRRRPAAAGELEGAEGRVRDQHPRESGGPRLPRGVVRGESRRHAAHEIRPQQDFAGQLCCSPAPTRRAASSRSATCCCALLPVQVKLRFAGWDARWDEWHKLDEDRIRLLVQPPKAAGAGKGRKAIGAVGIGKGLRGVKRKCGRGTAAAMSRSRTSRSTRQRLTRRCRKKSRRCWRRRRKGRGPPRGTRRRREGGEGGRSRRGRGRASCGGKAQAEESEVHGGECQGGGARRLGGVARSRRTDTRGRAHGARAKRRCAPARATC